jgi:hypothetical protein
MFGGDLFSDESSERSIAGESDAIVAGSLLAGGAGSHTHGVIAASTVLVAGGAARELACSPEGTHASTTDSMQSDGEEEALGARALQ